MKRFKTACFSCFYFNRYNYWTIINKIINEIRQNKEIKYVIIVNDDQFYESIRDKWALIYSELKIVKKKLFEVLF